jgi:hypothetical protein
MIPAHPPAIKTLLYFQLFLATFELPNFAKHDQKKPRRKLIFINLEPKALK